MSGQAARRHRYLTFCEVPDQNFRIFSFLCLASTSCTVAFIRSSDAKDLENVPVQFLLLRPESPRHEDVLHRRFADFDHLFGLVHVCQYGDRIEFGIDASF